MGVKKMLWQSCSPACTLDDSPESPEQSPAIELRSAAYEQDGAPVRKIGGSVSAPKVIYQVDPEMTPDARQAKFAGVVLVNLIVNTKGVPESVQVLRPVGMGLDQKAVDAVKQYRFRPAMESGVPVPVALNIEVNFKFF